MKQKHKFIKIILIVISFAIMIGATVYLWPIIANLTTKEGQIEFKQAVANSGVKGILMLFGLQFAQIFLPILPG